MNTGFAKLSVWAEALVAAGWTHFTQLVLLTGVLLLIDVAVGRRLGPAWRSALWLLFFVKLVLPTNLALPTSPFYWGRPSSVVAVDLGPVVVAPAIEESWAEPTKRVAGPARVVTARPAPPVESASWGGWALLGVVGWGSGVLGLGILSVRRHRKLRRLLRESVLASGAELAALARACGCVGLNSPVTLRVSAVAIAPLVIGLRRPVVHLPRVLLSRLSDEQLHAVLVHELYHVKRRDLWVAAGQSVARVFFFYHPLLWWVNARLSRLREQATDRAVLSHPDISGRAYSLALLETAALVSNTSGRSPFALGVIETKSQLQERITMNLHHPRSGRAQLGLSGLLTITLLGLVLLPMMGAPARPAAAASAPSATFVSAKTPDLLAKVEQAAAAIFAAQNRGDRAAFLNAFADNPIVLPDQSGLIAGRGGISEMSMRTPADLRYEPWHWGERNLVEMGAWIIETGTVAFHFRMSPEAPIMTDPRAALSIWEKAPDGGLRVKLLAWSQLANPRVLEQETVTSAFASALPEGRFGATGDFSAVLAAEEAFNHAFEIQDLDTAADTYATGATLLPPTAVPLHGREQIRDYLRGLPDGQRAKRVDREVVRVEGNEHHALVVNLYRWTFEPGGAGVPVTVVGKGVHIWERDGAGDWHVLFDLPNASQSMR